MTYASAGKSGQRCRASTSFRVHSPSAIRCYCCYFADDSAARLPETIELLKLSSGKVAKRLVIGKRMVLVLVIVLNAVLTGGSAMHRARHNHFRRELPGAFERCDAPGPSAEEAEAARGWCSHPRQRRDAPWALELRQTVGRTLCPFAVCEDRDANRRPQSIHKVVCLEAGCRCTDEGSYRCVQVVDEMEVLYLNGQEGRNNGTWLSKKIKVEVGCVCAAAVAQTGSTSFPNSLDE